MRHPSTVLAFLIGLTASFVAFQAFAGDKGNEDLDGASARATGRTHRVERDEASNDGDRSWAHYKLDDTISPFVGFVTTGGPDQVIVANDRGSQSLTAGGVTAAIRCGILLSRHELAFELSPPGMSAMITYTPTPMLQASGSYGYLIPIAHGRVASLYLPVRLGAGAAIIQETQKAFLGRFETGLTLAAAHFLFELHAPSVRYIVHTETSRAGTDSHHQVMVGFGATVAYAF